MVVTMLVHVLCILKHMLFVKNERQQQHVIKNFNNYRF